MNKSSNLQSTYQFQEINKDENCAEKKNNNE